MDEPDFEQEMKQADSFFKVLRKNSVVTLFLVESLSGPVESVIIIQWDTESSTWPEAMKNMKPLR